MAEESKNRRFWEFLDSPFTWGGIGVVAGAAIVSPSWFRPTFIGSGISVAIGLLRANWLKGSRFGIWLAGNVGLIALVAMIWFFVWKYIPKPGEPPTPEQIAQAVARKLGEAEKHSPPTHLPKSASADEIAASIIGKLPRSVPTLDLSNDELRAQAYEVSKQLEEVIHESAKNHFLAEKIADKTERESTLRQIENEYSTKPSNQLLFAKGNYLRDLLLARLKRPIPPDKLFDGKYNGSTFIVMPELLDQLADQLPK